MEDPIERALTILRKECLREKSIISNKLAARTRPYLGSEMDAVTGVTGPPSDEAAIPVWFPK